MRSAAPARAAGGCGCAAPRSEGAELCCCTVDELVHAIGRKYAMPILNAIGRGGTGRFAVLQHALGVSSSTLAETLSELERVGLVSRELPHEGLRAQYRLTAAGEALRKRLRPLLERVRYRSLE